MPSCSGNLAEAEVIQPHRCLPASRAPNVVGVNGCITVRYLASPKRDGLATYQQAQTAPTQTPNRQSRLLCPSIKLAILEFRCVHFLRISSTNEEESKWLVPGSPERKVGKGLHDPCGVAGPKGGEVLDSAEDGVGRGRLGPKRCLARYSSPAIPIPAAHSDHRAGVAQGSASH